MTHLAQFVQNLERRGTTVHVASTSREATAIALAIAKNSAAKLVVNSNAMVTEKLHINQHSEAAGCSALETDLGEWIVQLAKETPSHIIIPQYPRIVSRCESCSTSKATRSFLMKRPAGYARRRLQEKFATADIGLTG